MDPFLGQDFAGRFPHADKDGGTEDVCHSACVRWREIKGRGCERWRQGGDRKWKKINEKKFKEIKIKN
jgi:hypothetical protein